ncbi:hypothetical protein GT972_15090 [Sinimarinibacterium sp. NLF-5-8]|nr:hypothetical protein [Sinimarinibacterium sp. NLF-5-8]QHS11341.1 hypothetical protein GT972_15090 [Sinimarinibacterium sp. NLF-5-8]
MFHGNSLEAVFLIDGLVAHQCKGNASQLSDQLDQCLGGFESLPPIHQIPCHCGERRNPEKPSVNDRTRGLDLCFRKDDDTFRHSGECRNPCKPSVMTAGVELDPCLRNGGGWGALRVPSTTASRLQPRIGAGVGCEARPRADGLFGHTSKIAIVQLST